MDYSFRYIFLIGVAFWLGLTAINGLWNNIGKLRGYKIQYYITCNPSFSQILFYLIMLTTYNVVVLTIKNRAKIFVFMAKFVLFAIEGDLKMKENMEKEERFAKEFMREQVRYCEIEISNEIAHKQISNKNQRKRFQSFYKKEVGKLKQIQQAAKHHLLPKSKDQKIK